MDEFISNDKFNFVEIIITELKKTIDLKLEESRTFLDDKQYFKQIVERFDFKEIEKSLNETNKRRENSNNINIILFLLSSINNGQMFASFDEIIEYLTILGEKPIDIRGKISKRFELHRDIKNYFEKIEGNDNNEKEKKIKDEFSNKFGYQVNPQLIPNSSKILWNNFETRFSTALITLVNKYNIVNAFVEVSGDEFEKYMMEYKDRNPFDLYYGSKMSSELSNEKSKYFLKKNKLIKGEGIKNINYGLNYSFVLAYIRNLLSKYNKDEFRKYYYELSGTEVMLLNRIKDKQLNLNEEYSFYFFERKRLEKLDNYNRKVNELEKTYNDLLNFFDKDSTHLYLGKTIIDIYLIYMNHLFNNKSYLIQDNNIRFLSTFQDCIRQIGEEWSNIKKTVSINNKIMKNGDKFISKFFENIFNQPCFSINTVYQPGLNENKYILTERRLSQKHYINEVIKTDFFLIEHIFNVISCSPETFEKNFPIIKCLINFFDLCDIYSKLENKDKFTLIPK